MPKVVKKKSSSSRDSKIQRAIEVWQEQAKARYKIAMAVHGAQDGITKEAIERIRDRLVAYSTGLIKISPDGFSGMPVTVEVEVQYIDFNALYLAVGIMSDLAMVGVQIGNFEFPPGICSECGAMLTPKKGAKRAKTKR